MTQPPDSPPAGPHLPDPAPRDPASGDQAPRRLADRDIFGRVPKDHPDWSHRRGEPRGIALAWAVYLMFAAASVLSATSLSHGISIEAYRVAAGRLMILLTVGLCVLWPMLRLSQVRPRRVAGSLLLDMLILAAPLQLLIWVQGIMAQWSITVCATLGAVTTGWMLIVGSITMLGLSADTPRARALAMLGVLAVVLLPLAAGGGAAIWFSPLGAVGGLTADPTWITGRLPGIAPGAEPVAAWTVVIGLSSWAVALAARLVRPTVAA